MKIAHEQIEQNLIKLSLGILLGLLLFVGLCWGGWRTYTAWEQRHLVRRALAFISDGNLKGAALCVRRAWQIKPNADAARIMAQIGERTGDRAAVDWRRQVLQLVPASSEDALYLATSALQFDDIATAEHALSVVHDRDRARDNGAFHEASAQVAAMKQQPEEAERHWERAVALAPNDKSFQLQLGANPITFLRSDGSRRRPRSAEKLAQRTKATCTGDALSDRLCDSKPRKREHDPRTRARTPGVSRTYDR